MNFKQSYRIIHRGALALAKAERKGINIDVEYVETERTRWMKMEKELTEEFFQSEIGTHWKKKFGAGASLQGNEQTAYILYDYLGLRPPGKQPDKLKVDQEALNRLSHPVIATILRARKINKIYGTYLEGILRETNDDGFLRPSFILHKVITFRSACLNPNFQNIPIRDPEMGMIIRNAFIPRPGNRLCEADYKALEVMIACGYHQDPTMIEYLVTGYDMHRDMAKECFILIDSMKLTKTEFKTTRFYAKNGFTFPEFYGSYWVEVAANLWEMMGLHNLTVEGIPIKEHLRKHGITRLGEITKDKITGRIVEVDTGKGTYFNHIKEVEKNFWNIRFPVYKEWKNKVYAEYLKCGYMDYLTGFRVRGVFKKTERTNYPVQGSAFHCLLRTFASMSDWTEEMDLKSGLIGQIHDSSLSDICPDEFDEYLAMLQYKSTTETMEEFPWINVPLSVELEISDTDQSWFHKKEYKGAE